MVNFTMLVHNRPKLTLQAIRSLQGTKDITISILNDASDCEGMDLRRWTVNYIHPENKVLLTTNTVSKGTAAARNQVIADSETFFGRGDYLYLSDNDVFFLGPDWLDFLLGCYESAWNRGFKVLGAYNHPYHQPMASYRTGLGYEVREVAALALQSMLMRWDVWDTYGPFPMTAPGKVCQGEDVEFSRRIVSDGGKLGVISPQLLVNTGITNSFGDKIPGWELVAAQAPEGVIVE